MGYKPILDDGGGEWFKESVKAIIFALFSSLYVVGYGYPDLDDPETLDKIIAEAIDEDKLHDAPNKQTPYTGWLKEMHNNGQVRKLTQYKDGKKMALQVDGTRMGGGFGKITTRTEKGMGFGHGGAKTDKSGQK